MLWSWTSDSGVRLLVDPIPEGSREDRRAREREAVAGLLSELLPGALIAHRPDGAPYLEGMPDVYISISHSVHYAAIALAPFPIGIDIEEPREQLRRVASRVLSDSELAAADTLPSLLHAWTVKEALYKLAPSPEACDFRSYITVNPPTVNHHPAKILLTHTLPPPPACISVVSFNADALDNWQDVLHNIKDSVDASVIDKDDDRTNYIMSK